MINLPLAQVLIASVIAGIIGVSSLFIGSSIISAPVSVSLQPPSGTKIVGEEFQVNVVINSSIPVNVFKGQIEFNPEQLSVAAIDYNTSIADLWAELPWYSNGDGTLNFTGGTTKAGGFTGNGTLLTITFKADGIGESAVAMSEMRVLKHDGLGTEISLPTPIDALFAVTNPEIERKVVFNSTLKGPTVTILPQAPNTDLNGDGKQSMADISIFMADLAKQNPRSDLNGDGVINLEDLSILMP